jgi:hypothetical protein
MVSISRNRYSITADYGIMRSFVMNLAPLPALLILVAGPYRSNTGDDPVKIAQNLHRMNEAALELFRRGHLPITGEALALPLIELAGSQCIGDATFNEIFHPLARRLIDRVDGVIRVGGPSVGADDMISRAQAAGKPVFFAISEVPSVG